MLRHLRGQLLKKDPTSVVIDCSGVGFGVHITPKDAERIGRLGTEVALHIYMHVPEGDVRLYGFLEESDLDYFQFLFSVDRVGPKTAMAVVSVLPWDTFLAAVSAQDPAPLCRVPGIGQKTAERIVFELREKVPAAKSAHAVSFDAGAVEALLSLGFDRRSAQKAVAEAQSAGAASLESLVTAALRKLGQPS
ncbi:Holliday junction branch migration protein RuvA [bacterium]|nr:Holliday junction branch migration protein RuvA [bacterium]